MRERIERILFTEETIQSRVKEMGNAISSDYQINGTAKDIAQRPLITVCILQGAIVFMADLMRAIEIPVEYDFMSISSYGSATSPGAVRLLHDLSHSITGRDVLVVEDIIDTGCTANYIKRGLLARKPASFRICTLLDKPFRREEAIELEYVGFQLKEDLFVVGYGMDYAGVYRNLPYIALLKSEYR
jgi:hypoxanthine phosphoribosyltransferase